MFISFASIVLASYISVGLATPIGYSNDITRDLSDSVNARELFVRAPVAGKPATAAAAKPAAAKPATSKSAPKTTAPGSGASCAIKPKTKKRTLSSTLDGLDYLYRRMLGDNGPEFIGWHGTNGDTAALWAKLKKVQKPVREDGTVAGKSVLDAELGPGLYLADDIRVAGVAGTANANAQNKALKAAKQPETAVGKVCAIFAASSSHWRLIVPKAEIPDAPAERLRGNTDKAAAARARYLAEVSGKKDIVLMGPLDAISGHVPHQILIPETWNPSLTAQCFDLNANGDPKTPADIAHIPTIDYSSAAIRTSWKIVAGNSQAAKDALAGGDKGCVIQ